MQNATSEIGLDVEQEYRAIEAALLDNPRGRWFLAEHGRRSRRLDSVLLEESIWRLQSALREPPAVLGRIVAEVEQLATDFATTRETLLARPAPQPGTESGKRPVQLMLDAAEELHELMWQLQGRDVDTVTCERIGRQAMLIHALGAAQAAESERTLAMAAQLDALARRVDGLLTTLAEEQRGEDDGDRGPLAPVERASVVAVATDATAAAEAATAPLAAVHSPAAGPAPEVVAAASGARVPPAPEVTPAPATPPAAPAVSPADSARRAHEALL
jgi:hypothetical protein